MLIGSTHIIYAAPFLLPFIIKIIPDNLGAMQLCIFLMNNVTYRLCFYLFYCTRCNWISAAGSNYSYGFQL
uniref:Uncharacterized protein n=1 Tax=Anguilla anguilla TaxID=7936 RepID=A0A0E9WUA2_ANGAN